MPKFGANTLSKFDDASVSIPPRPLVRAFEAAAIRPSDDPGGAEGSRQTQFRRYVAGVDQHQPQDLNRLGDALQPGPDRIIVRIGERVLDLRYGSVFRKTTASVMEPFVATVINMC